MYIGTYRLAVFCIAYKCGANYMDTYLYLWSPSKATLYFLKTFYTLCTLHSMFTMLSLNALQLHSLE